MQAWIAELCSKNKDKKSESNSQHLQFNMSGYIPYRRRPPPVRNMRAVLKKASWGTRRVFRSPPCSKQASGVQKGYSVPETPFYGTGRGFMCTGKGLLMYRLKRRKSAPALRSVILRKTAICILLLLPLNSCRQLWAATKPLQAVMDYLKLPPTPLNYCRLPRPTARLPPSRPDRYQATANYAGAHQ